MKSPKSLPRPKTKPPLMLRRIVGHSMMPTLPPGTNIVAIRWFIKPKPGRVAVFRHDNKEKIKRIDDVKPGGSLKMLGDHLESSTDSRHFGDIAADQVLAIVVWPRTRRR